MKIQNEYDNLLKTNWVYEYHNYLIDNCEDLYLRLKLHKMFDEFRQNSNFII